MSTTELNLTQPLVLTQAPIRLWSLRGRMGRAHYIVACLGSIILAFLFMYLAGLLMLLSGQLGRTVYIIVSVLVFYGVLPIFFTVLTIKRAHDFNVGGWLALVLLVPVINLLFCFMPGNVSDNRYGAPPPAPSSTLKVLATLLPLILLSAFLATGGPQLTEPASLSPASPPATSLKPYTP